MPSLRRLAAVAALALACAGPVRAEEVLRDAETEALFADIARPLVVAAGLTPASVKVVLIRSPEINAFAAEGQNVYIYSGLIENADTVNWLQGVIAHELGHIAGGHSVRTGEAIGRANHISILSLIAAVGLTAAGAPEAGLAALGLGVATAEAGVLAYSRDQESSADLAGASYLAKTGTSGRGSIGFFNRLLGLEYRAGVPQKNSYGRTHPLDGERIGILDAVYKASPAWNTPPDPVLEARFQRVKAKLVGFVEEPPRTFQLYPAALTTDPARYAHAFAYHKAAEPVRALAEADALLAAHPGDPYLLELKGQILFESGDVAAALPVLRAAVAAAPRQPLIATLLGHALVTTEDPGEHRRGQALDAQGRRHRPREPLRVVRARRRLRPRGRHRPGRTRHRRTLRPRRRSQARGDEREDRPRRPARRQPRLAARRRHRAGRTERTRQEEAQVTRRALTVLAAVALAGCGGPKVAPTDKAAIERIVHDYILAHPEIIPEAMTGMQSRDVARLLRSNRAEVETPFPGAVAGNPQGDVTLVEFFDYACPYCRAAHNDIKKLLAADPKVRVVYRDFPVLTEGSGLAAMAALSAARQGRYAALHDRLFETEGHVDRERTIALIRAAGLNERRTAADLTDAELKAELKKNVALGRALGLTGTPSFIVGDRILSGAVGYEKLAAAVAAVRAGKKS